MSHIYTTPSSYYRPATETVPPPQYQAQDIQAQEIVPSASTSNQKNIPIVIPQSTNLFFVKSFSPFTRCYPPSLSMLSNAITESEFLAFVDRLNHVFISLPIFQVAHIVGGTMMSVQGVLPVQAVGGVLQVSSVLASAGVSFVRVRKFMKSANAEIFTPRGLVCRIMGTKKMMAAINFADTDVNGKLKLPPLETVHDLGAHHPHSAPASIQSDEGRTVQGPFEIVSRLEDPRLLRLQALEGYIAPLSFDVPSPPPESWLSKMSQKPLRWANERQMNVLERTQAKCHKKRDSKASAVSAATLSSDDAIAEINRQINMLHYSQESSIQGSRHASEELERLEAAKREEEANREKKVKEIYKGSDKKMEKVYKKEEKVANRILWIVITKADSTTVEEESLFRVDSRTTTLNSPHKRAMHIKSIPMSWGKGNNYAYLVIDEKTKDAVIIDPAYTEDVIPTLTPLVKSGEINLTAIINTHHHHDHAGGNRKILSEYADKNLPVIGGKDSDAVTKTPAHNSGFSFGSIVVKALHTPCHTQDSICWFMQDGNQKVVFTGDTLFHGGCGRFFEGSAEEMDKALNKTLGSLPDDTKVYPGHEYTKANAKFGESVSKSKGVAELVKYAGTNEQTTGRWTIADEKRHNVFMMLGDAEIQKATGQTEPVKVMEKLREMKNNF
ncbi:hypothetical protein VF21_04260 [Pseudogymnoascus sp. 05NY08]|nr:hypothetical protein VF21_04260 [Pseudogymnoascus sp. 05NY08]